MASAVFAYTHNPNGGTDVTCINMVTSKPVTMTLPIDPTMLIEWHNSKTLKIQDAFPHLTSAQREFLLTGMSEEEWNDLFTEED